MRKKLRNSKNSSLLGGFGYLFACILYQLSFWVDLADLVSLVVKYSSTEFLDIAAKTTLWTVNYLYCEFLIFEKLLGLNLDDGHEKKNKLLPLL